MSYRFKVERGWKNRYAEKVNWGNPDVFHVNADTEEDATTKVEALSDTKRLAVGNRYLYRVVAAEELPPEPVVQAQPERPASQRDFGKWRGSAGGYIRGETLARRY